MLFYPLYVKLSKNSGHILRFVFFFTIFSSFVFGIEIIQTPIEFGDKRVELTKKYINKHYGLDVEDINIKPKIVLVHYTAIDDYEKSLARFTSQTLPGDRPDISNASTLNVSTHFMIERDGTIHQLMPLNIMARHVIGLNYSSIGIENVGGEGFVDNLTQEQLTSNILLIKWLKEKIPSIEYLVGHHEYRCFEKSDLWLEKDDGYRTKKHDPGEEFMTKLRAKLKGFKKAPCSKSADDN